MAWCPMLGVVIGVFVLVVQDSKGQEYCSDLDLPLGELFEEHSKKQVRTGTSVKQRSIGRLDECLTLCVQTDGCYGVDFNHKRRPPQRTRCWLLVGEVAEMETNRFVNHHRRLPCREIATTEITTTATPDDETDSDDGNADQDDYQGILTLGWSAVDREFYDAVSFEIYLMTHIEFEHAGTVWGIRYFWGDQQVQMLAFLTWGYVEGDRYMRMRNMIRAQPEAGENRITRFATEVRVEAGDSFAFFAVGMPGPTSDPPPPFKAIPYDIGTQDQCSDTLHVSAIKQDHEAGDGDPYYKAADISSLDDCRIYSVEVIYEPDYDY